MDSLTQIVLGAAVGEATLGKKVGNKAMLWGAIAGTIPDLDVMIGRFTDTVTELEVHRGFSHSILFALLFAPVFGWLIQQLYPKAGTTWKDWAKLMFWGLFTHPLLDLFTTWGTQLFYPLPDRLALKTIFVIDPLYTLPFLTCLLFALRLRKNDPKRAFYGRLGLILSSSYLLITMFVKAYANTIFTQALDAQQITYSRFDTRPTPLNILLWTSNIETEEAFLIGYYSFLDDSKDIRFKVVPKKHYLITSLMTQQEIRRLLSITEGYYTVEQKGENQFLVNDLRFGELAGWEPESSFVFTYVVDTKDNQVVQITQKRNTFDDAPKLMRTLWKRILGNR
ncbi:MAG: metal-dependent hydrolase [Thermonemataceae bacterium]